MSDSFGGGQVPGNGMNQARMFSQVPLHNTQTIFNGQLTPTGEMTSFDSPDLSAFRAANMQNYQASQMPPPFLEQQRLPVRKPRQKTPRTKVLPPELNIDGPSSNTVYQSSLLDNNLTLSPQALGFLPSSYWLALDTTFGDLVTKFFQRKNNANCRFPHKLYNALAIVEKYEKLFNILGVKWITDTVFKVDKYIFGRLLGISSIDGGLFHRQGNFPSHGFTEVTSNELQALREKFNLKDVDQDRIRLLHHPLGRFSRTSDEETINQCKWGA